MTLFARAAKTASGAVIRRLHIEQKGIPGAVRWICLCCEWCHCRKVIARFIAL